MRETYERYIVVLRHVRVTLDPAICLPVGDGATIGFTRTCTGERLVVVGRHGDISRHGGGQKQRGKMEAGRQEGGG